jgi:hypothetical protein
MSWDNYSPLILTLLLQQEIKALARAGWWSRHGSSRREGDPASSSNEALALWPKQQLLFNHGTFIWQTMHKPTAGTILAIASSIVKTGLPTKTIIGTSREAYVAHWAAPPVVPGTNTSIVHEFPLGSTFIKER